MCVHYVLQVLAPSEEHERIRHKKTDVFLVFFGDQNQCAWLARSKVDPWMCGDYSERISKQTRGLQKAVEEAMNAIQVEKAEELERANLDGDAAGLPPTPAKEPE